MVMSRMQTFVPIVVMLLAVVAHGCSNPPAAPAFVGVWRSGDHRLEFTADGCVSEYLPPPPPEVAPFRLAKLTPMDGSWTQNGKKIYVKCTDGRSFEFEWKIDKHGAWLTLTSQFFGKPLPSELFLRQNPSISNRSAN